MEILVEMLLRNYNDKKSYRIWCYYGKLRKKILVDRKLKNMWKLAQDLVWSSETWKHNNSLFTKIAWFDYVLMFKSSFTTTYKPKSWLNWFQWMCSVPIGWRICSWRPQQCHCLASANEILFFKKLISTKLNVMSNSWVEYIKYNQDLIAQTINNLAIQYWWVPCQ